MRELVTEIEIQATPERVWALLTNFDGFPLWNPFIPEASGSVAVGERIAVTLQVPGRSPTSFQPTLTKVEPQQELRWLGHLLAPGLFDGEHIFSLEPLNVSRVRFVQREVFRGLLVFLVLPVIGASTRAGFEAMNQALKAEAEKGTR